jgi:hypothetical protein
MQGDPLDVESSGLGIASAIETIMSNTKLIALRAELNELGITAARERWSVAACEEIARDKNLVIAELYRRGVRW